MLKPNSKQQQAIAGLASSSAFFEEYISYLESDREYERTMMEEASPEDVQKYQGRAGKLTELINFLKSQAK